MKSKKSNEFELQTPAKPCVVCKDLCLPYGYTKNWGHVCSRKCSKKYDETKYQPDMFIKAVEL